LPVTTRLEDLPAFHILRVESADYPRLHGIFNHVRSVKPGSSWLYHPTDPLIGDLLDLDEATGRAVFEAPFWNASNPIQRGSRPQWLDGYWHAYHVTMILDPDAGWRRVRLETSDAQHFVENGQEMSTKACSVPKGAVATRTVPGAWDHEHCILCMERVGRWGDEYGYVAGGAAYVDSHDWLCDHCGEKYAVPRSLAFVWDGAWEPR
jgi:hypothetical protein